MSDAPFDREIINVRERPLSSDINQVESYAQQRLLEWIFHAGLKRGLGASDVTTGMETGLLGDSFKVREQDPVALAVDITKGIGLIRDDSALDSDIGGIVNVNDLARLKPVVLEADQAVTLDPADGTFDRIDIIEIAPDRRYIDATSRDILDPVTGLFGSTPVDKTLTYTLDGRVGSAGALGINYIAGTPSGSPAVPATTAGYVKIAQILVPTSAADVDGLEISDFRPILPFPYSSFDVLGEIVLDNDFTSVTSSKISAPPGVSAGFEIGATGDGSNVVFWVFLGDASLWEKFSTAKVGTRIIGGLPVESRVLASSGPATADIGISGGEQSIFNSAAFHPGAVKLGLASTAWRETFQIVERNGSGTIVSPSVAGGDNKITVRFHFQRV